MTMKITECYVIFINCFWNWNDWTARDAKFFDQCQLSKDTDITIYEYKNDPDPIYFLGDKDANTVLGYKCVPGANEIIPIWRDVMIFGQTMLANLADYMDYVAPVGTVLGESLYQSK